MVLPDEDQLNENGDTLDLIAYYLYQVLKNSHK